MADAQRALATFDQSGTVSKMLAETGYGNNPDVLRIFARVGRALGEDKLIGKAAARTAGRLKTVCIPTCNQRAGAYL